MDVPAFLQRMFHLAGVKFAEHDWLMQSIFETLRQQGQLKEQTTQQLFSEAANTFLADRFVSGTCPNADCNFEVRVPRHPHDGHCTCVQTAS